MQISVRHWRLLFLAIAVALTLHGDLPIRLLQLPPEKHTARIHPPSEFYSQNLDCGGLPIRAHRSVSRRALRFACGNVNLMLRHIPNVRANLIAAGVEVHIIGRKQKLTDLPEFRAFKGRRDGKREWDQERGISGETVACAEENLLELPDDPYYPMNVDTCVHEFAHAIHLEGISRSLRGVFEQRYKEATGGGLWRGQYAATNELEFFAEMSTWYFGGPRPTPRGGILLIYDTDGLMLYDPKTFAMLDDFYQGRIEIPKFNYSQAKRVVPHPLGRSTNCAGDGILIFDNQSSSSFKLYLVTPEGATAPWGDIVPYQHKYVWSSPGCRWLLSDDRDQPLDIFVPQTQYSYAPIN
jgi:hypothetical protein